MVTSFAGLMRVQADIAVAVMRAHHSAWNERYEVVPPEQVSKVKWDCTIQYNQRDVIEPLQEMFDRAYLRHDNETLARYREALRIVFHENIHLLAGPGTSLAFPLDAYEGKAHKVFEEGVTERAAQNALDGYIDELGLGEIAPGIRKARTPEAYAAYVPAVDEFSRQVGADVGLDPAEVVRRIAVVNAAEKFQVAAELLYAKHLSRLVPETAKADAVRQIAEAMHGSFAAIQDYDSKNPADIRIAALAGRSAYRKASEEVRTIAGQWSGNQELRRTLDAGLGGTAPPQKPRQDGRGPEVPRADGTDSGQATGWNAKRGATGRSASGPAGLSHD